MTEATTWWSMLCHTLRIKHRSSLSIQSVLSHRSELRFNVNCLSLIEWVARKFSAWYIVMVWKWRTSNAVGHVLAEDSENFNCFEDAFSFTTPQKLAIHRSYLPQLKSLAAFQIMCVHIRSLNSNSDLCTNSRLDATINLLHLDTRANPKNKELRTPLKCEDNPPAISCGEYVSATSDLGSEVWFLIYAPNLSHAMKP